MAERCQNSNHMKTGEALIYPGLSHLSWQKTIFGMPKSPSEIFVNEVKFISKFEIKLCLMRATLCSRVHLLFELFVEKRKQYNAPYKILQPSIPWKNMILDEKPNGIPFTLPHPSRKFFQLFTLSIGVFDLIQSLESISECKEETPS